MMLLKIDKHSRLRDSKVGKALARIQQYLNLALTGQKPKLTKHIEQKDRVTITTTIL